jgi:putative DNA primase/helicase
MSDQTLPSDNEIVERLAALGPLEYDRERPTAADELGVSVGALDKAVKKVRQEITDTAAKGRPITFYEPEPWPEPVDGSEALTEAANHIKRHMRIKEADAYACALWACHTFMFDEFDHSPRLCITAHTEESGKTVLMSHLVGNLSNKPFPVELMKPAPFFRLAEDYKPTFLIDECDVFIRDDMELAAALNNGWEPHGGVSRCSGDDNEVRIFSTFTPTAMAGIELQRKLPATTLGRSIVVSLERAIDDEIDVIFNRKSHQEGIRETAHKLARFINDNRQRIANCEPGLPEGVRNRLADKWTPMFKIAEIAGGDWPKNAEMALRGQQDVSEPSRALELLIDIKKVMPNHGHLFTKTLISKICALDDSPWLEYNFKGRDEEARKISDRQISNLVGQFGVKPKDVKIAGITKKGYHRDDLENAFKRYIPVSLPNTCPPSATPLLSMPDAASSGSSCATPKSEVADSPAPKPLKNADGSGVADKTGARPEDEESDIKVITL